MGIFNKLMKAVKLTKKSRDTFNKNVDNWSNKCMEQSKQKQYDSMIKTINELKKRSEIRSYNDLKLLLDGKISNEEINKKAIENNKILQKEINKLSDNPTFEELKNIIKLLDRLMKG